MKKKRILIIAGFLLLTAMNLLIYLNRDRFAYNSYKTPAELYESCNESCIDQWQKYVNDYPAGDFEQVNKLLDPVISRTDSTPARIRKLSEFLLHHLDDHRGVPSALLLSKSPFGQFNWLRLHPEEKLWCGNWSNIFAYFAWNRGITTRIVEIKKTGDHHVFNECFVPELDAWVLVDLTNRIILPVDQNKYLNGFEYAKNTGINRAREYFNTSYPWIYYSRYNLESIYSTGSRIRRYLVADPWHHQLSLTNDKPGNFLFYVKLIVLCGWLAFLFLLVFSQLLRR